MKVVLIANGMTLEKRVKRKRRKKGKFA